MPISATDLNKAYLAYFGRPADLTGKTYFATLEQADVIKAFDASAESKALYGNDAAAKVSAIYQNLFNRDAEPAGLVYWTTLINQGRVTAAGAAFAILNGAQGTDATAVQNKLAASEAFVAAMDTTAELVGYSGLDAAASARNWLKGVSADAASLTAAVAGAQAAVNAAVAVGTGEGGAGYQLTNGTDVASSNVFTAGLVYTPGGDDRINSLQDEDRLTGTGTNATLNATLGNANDNGGTVITPTLNNIKTVNAAFTGSGGGVGGRVGTLDLQDATGVDAVNITRISTGFSAIVQNITTAASQLSISNSNSPLGNGVGFTFLGSAVAGTADSTTLTLKNVNVSGIRVQEHSAAGTDPVNNGFETINLVSTGSANTVGVLLAEDLQTLNISGTQNLNLGTRGATLNGASAEAVRYGDVFRNADGSLSKIDASAFEGNLDLTLGSVFNAGADNTSGVNVKFDLIAGKGDDTIRLTQGTVVGGSAATRDNIDGGEGNNTLVLLGSSQINAAGTALAPVANVTNIQALEVRSGHDDDNAVVAVADTITVNADAFDKLASIYVRNEGQNDTIRGAGVDGILGTADDTFAVDGVFNSVAEGMTVNLNNLTSAQANGITIAHGTTGNSTIANNVLNVGLKVSTGAADTATVTIVDGTNVDPVFNANVSAAAVERVTLVDSDTESNTVHLNQGAFTQAGSSITLQGGAAGQYLNLDSFSAAAVAANGVLGYGYATDGSVGSSTSVFAAAAATAGVPAAVSTSQRDNTVSTVFWGTAGNGADGATRHLVENIAAGDYLGDVVVRVGDLTRADGVSSMSITTGVGNDTIIFDAFGLTSAGFTSGDTVAAGAGTDTLVIDGNTATIPGTPRVDHQTSEWDNLTGVDVLRFATNAGVANVGNGALVANAGGAYYAHIDNDFVSQTDAGNRLTVVNNDGSLGNNTESDLVLDLRGLSQSKWVTLVGANGVGTAGISSNRVVVDDISANKDQILNGGDTDVRVTTTVGYVAGNNNVYEVRNTANVSINDLAKVSNFGQINFTNDQAVAQTLSLTLNNTVVENLVDSSNTAVSAATQEVLAIVANDNGLIASALNIDARQVTGFHSLNVTGSGGGNDVLTLNSNVGGSTTTANLGASLGDRVNWTGGSATTTATINLGAGTHQFQDGAVTTTHNIAGAEIIDLTGLAAANTFVSGTAAAETFLGRAGGTDTYNVAGTGVDISNDTIRNFDVLAIGADAGADTTTIAQGFGSAFSVTGLVDADNDVLLIKQGAAAFAVLEASAAAVNVAGEYFLDSTGPANDLLTYFDQTLNAAVTVTLVGSANGAVAVVAGDLQYTA